MSLDWWYCLCWLTLNCTVRNWWLYWKPKQWKKKGFLFLQIEEDACELKVGLRNPLQGQQPVLLQSTSPVSGWITQSEYLRRQSTSYFLSMCAILLWNDFCTSVTYKNNHTLDIFILFFFFVTTIVSFLFCYIPACLTTYRPSGLNINDRTCQIRLNIHNTFNAAALILLCLLFLIEFRRGTEEAKAVMKCEHLCRQVLHVCAALKVSGSYFHCAISGWS